MSIKLITFILSAVIFVFVVNLIRKEKLTFKYAFTWMIVCILGMLFSTFDQLLFRISDLIGFTLPSNFIFFSLLSALVFLMLLFTIFLCQQNDRNDKIAQKVGMLENQLEDIKKKIGK